MSITIICSVITCIPWCYCFKSVIVQAHAQQGRNTQGLNTRRRESWGPPKSLPVAWGFSVKLQRGDLLITPLQMKCVPSGLALVLVSSISLSSGCDNKLALTGWLNTLYFSWFWRLRSLRSRRWQIRRLVSALFLVYRQSSSSSLFLKGQHLFLFQMLQ